MRHDNKNKMGVVYQRNFQWIGGCDCTYDTYYPCRNGSDCCDNDFCRCGIIENAKVTSAPNTADLAKTHWNIRGTRKKKGRKLSVVDSYCVERILSINKFWDIGLWEVVAGGGYYGQEIDGIYFDPRIAQQIDEEVAKLLRLRTNKSKIEFILNLEYGYLLDSVKDKRWCVKTVNKDDMKFGQQDHYRNLERDAIQRYRDYDLPRGICLQEENGLRVIDGYHRLAAAEDGKVEVIAA